MKWVGSYLLDSRGSEEFFETLESSGGIDACPTCAAAAEIDWNVE